MAFSQDGSWLLAAAREAAVGTMVENPLQGDERLRPIVERVLFTRNTLMPTYHAVMIAIVLCFAIAHWTSRYRRTRRRDVKRVKSIDNSAKTDADNITDHSFEASSSPSSSTLSSRGRSPPHLNHESKDERSPLLQSHDVADRKTRGSRLVCKLQASLLYQPRPIPFVKKVLPSNSTSIFVLLCLGVNIFYALFKVPLSIGFLFVLADRSGALFAANLPWLYILAAKNQPLKFFTGRSYESLNILHRRLGEFLCLIALVHSGTMVGVWYTLLRPLGFSLARFLMLRIILLGIFALICYEVLYLSSLGNFRQRFYELFLATHVVLQLAALILLFFHHPASRIYVGISLGIFILDRFVFRMLLKSRNIQATVRLAQDGETAIVSAMWHIPNKQALSETLDLSKKNILSGWQPTQHVFISAPHLSWGHALQAHPFTIASEAPSKNLSLATLNLIVRAHDGFTKDIVKHAELHETVNLRLDGPYGSLRALEMMQDSDYTMIIAGGSGIALAYPFVSALLSTYLAKGNIENNSTTSCNRRICLLWIIHETAHRSWIDESRIDQLRAGGVEIIIPTPTSEAGRPDVAEYIRSWASFHSYGSVSDEKFGVVCSGPDSMNRTARNACAGLAWEGYLIDVEIEKFGW